MDFMIEFFKFNILIKAKICYTLTNIRTPIIIIFSTFQFQSFILLNGLLNSDTHFSEI
ncbi:hypothetical protein Patl1_36628 [Pistacia atlantica]|nr:hypothetical protein Patl1_36628 [Pistacia atlantica]